MGDGSDHSEAYSALLKRYRWAAWAMRAMLVVVLASPLLLAFGVSESGFTVFLVAVVVPLGLLVVPLKKMNTCPACERFMGRSVGTHCTCCGARVRS